ARWMSVGFIHGVMNTDNCAISGETIDYGPCAFVDDYHPETVFSSIDRMGRYAYGAQADIIIWNMAQLATSLLALMPDPQAALPGFQSAVEGAAQTMRAAWLRHMAPKIGLARPDPSDAPLVADLLQIMADGGSDFTNTFAALTTGDARDEITDQDAWQAWSTRWRDRLASEHDALETMARANPILIPRNHQIEAMIGAAVAGDDAPFHRLMAALSTPFTADPETSDLRLPPTAGQRVHATFCGT
ncbi:MAG: protein adenylyltransferase SelO family protein, partial [Paracoccaceae bacterium]